MNHLSHNIHDAMVQPAIVIASVTPYNKEPFSDGEYYGHIRTFSGKARTCVIRVCEALRTEIERLKYPGGATIAFRQQRNRDWLVCVNAQNIIASSYFRMHDSDVQNLVRALEKGGDVNG